MPHLAAFAHFSMYVFVFSGQHLIYRFVVLGICYTSYIHTMCQISICDATVLHMMCLNYLLRVA